VGSGDKCPKARRSGVVPPPASCVPLVTTRGASGSGDSSAFVLPLVEPRSRLNGEPWLSSSSTNTA